MKSLRQWIRKEWIVAQLNRDFKKKRYDQVLKTTNAELEKENFFFELFTFRIWSFLETQQLEDAKITVIQALIEYSEHPVFLSLHGEVCYKLGDYDAADESLHRALSMTSGNLQVEYLLGLNYVARGDMEKASQYFDNILRYDPTLLQTRLLAMAESYIFQSRTKR